MQIVRFERDNFDLFCPVSGQPVLDQNREPSAASLRGCWFELALDEPIGLCEELQESWRAHLESCGPSAGESAIVTFLESLERSDWVAFQITSYEEPLRQIWFSTWYLLDLSDQEPG
jgi:hypothetical protein